MPQHPQAIARRRLILTAAALLPATLSAIGSAAVRQLTPPQSRGPFYPDRLPLDQDNDLTRLSPTDQSAAGEITELTGRVVDQHGSPLQDTLVEIWQCDANGRYIHSGDRGGSPRDPGFQGYGRFRTGANGGYRFRTIKPVPYPGRAPHIHVAVTRPNGQRLVTQLYVEGAPDNARDLLRRSLSASQRAAVTVPFEPDAGSETFSAHFDIVLA